MADKILIIFTTMCSLFALYSYFQEYKEDPKKKKRFRFISGCTVLVVIINSIIFIM